VDSTNNRGWIHRSPLLNSVHNNQNSQNSPNSVARIESVRPTRFIVCRRV
jgi:hypothetical protein